MSDKRLSESKAIIYVLKPGDHQAGVVGDSFDMRNFHHATFIMQSAVLTGDAVLKIFSGATAAAKTTSLPFKYRNASGDQGAANGDQFGAEAAVVAADGLTLTAATFDNKTLICEVDESEMTDNEEWLTFDLSAAASALNASVIAILTPRYAQLNIPTAI